MITCVYTIPKEFTMIFDCKEIVYIVILVYLRYILMKLVEELLLGFLIDSQSSSIDYKAI